MGEGCELRWERGLRWIRGRSARGPASTAMQVLLGLPAAGTASSEPGLLRALHPVVLVGTANHRTVWLECQLLQAESTTPGPAVLQSPIEGHCRCSEGR